MTHLRFRWLVALTVAAMLLAVAGTAVAEQGTGKKVRLAIIEDEGAINPYT